MKENHIIKVMAVLLISFTSCKKYLDLKANGAQIVPQTTLELQALLDNSRDMNDVTPGYGEASADNYFLSTASYNARNDKEKAIYTWQPFESTGDQDWSANYFPIYISNLCLELIEKNKKTAANEKEWNNVKGSALFFRSYYYLNLAWVYGKAYDETTAGSDAGVVFRDASDFNIPSVRISVKESYERVIHDTRTAIDLLPDHPQIATRPSKTAAYGLLARAYLSMRIYDSCLKYADLALSIYHELLDYNNPADVAISSSFPFKLLNKETVFFTRLNNVFSMIGPSNSLVDSVLFASYHPDDLRQKAFFRPNGNYQRFKGSYLGSSANFSGLTTAELYLMKAECLARQGNTAPALDALNILMEKRWSNLVPFQPVTAIDAADALNKVLQERRKELLFRGLRWMDIKRLNKEGRNIVPTRLLNGQQITLASNHNRYALLIPTDIILLTGLEQNPGW